MDRRIIGVLVLLDAVAIALAGLVATLLRFGTLQIDVAIELDIALQYWQLSLYLAPVWVAFLLVEGMYDIDRLSWDFAELTRIGRALALGVVGVIILTFAIKLPGLSRYWLLFTWLFSTLLAFVGRALVQMALASMRKRGKMIYRTLVIGTNDEALRLVEILAKTHAHGLVPVGCLSSSDRAGEESLCAADVPCLGPAAEAGVIATQQRIDTAVVASSAFTHEAIASMISGLRKAGVRIHISSGLFEVLTTRIFVREVAGVPLISIKRLGFTALNRAVKRVFDIVVSLSLIVLGMPLWLVLAVLIKTGSPGPIFYRQDRVGKAGSTFGMYKFRSMVADAAERRAELEGQNEADGPIFKMKSDPRVTPVGKFIRRYSLDEFPQLINVLVGDMSLVGPRPPLPSETEHYADQHWRRLEVHPGMTGLWQVSGRSDLSFDEMVRLDLFYIENWSMWFDVSIIARTVPAMLSSRGAY